jgi:hypothetical protein
MENEQVRIFMRAQELWRPLATAFLLALLLPVGLFAQEKGTIVGMVTDSTGSVMPGVNVTVTQIKTGLSRTVVTNAAGLYAAPGLPIGDYSVTAEAKAFKTYERTGITLNVNDTVRVDIQMQVGEVKETVTVTASAVKVQTDSAEISEVIQGRQLAQLAINGRNFIALAALVPGASANLPTFNLPIAVGSSNTISFNGNRSDHNMYTIDGAETYDRGCGGCVTVMPSMDAIAEFKVETSNYAAGVGFNSSAVTSMALKSGTQGFHGSLWEFVRNDAVDANSFFANKAGSGKPPLKFNDFGWNLGGPVYIPGHYNTSKQKTFFFFNQEWRKLRQGSGIFAPAIPAAERSGDFSRDLTGVNDANGNDTGAIFVPTPLPGQTLPVGYVAGQPFPGNIIPASLQDANAVTLTSTGYIFPLPNTADGKFFSAAPSVPIDTREEIVRVDHNISDKIRIMGSYIHDTMVQQTPTSMWWGPTYPTVGTTTKMPGTHAVVKLTWLLSPTAVNEVRLNYNNDRIDAVPTGNFAKPSDLGPIGDIFPGNDLNRIPGIGLWGSKFGVSYTVAPWPWKNAYDMFQVEDILNKSVGNHALKFGGMVMRNHHRFPLRSLTQGEFTFLGDFTQAPYAGGSSGNEFADLLLGRAFAYDELALKYTTYARALAASFYFADSWRVSPRLSLQYGVRYQLMPHNVDKYDHLSNFYPDRFDPAQAQTPRADGTLDPDGPGFQAVTGPLSAIIPGLPMYMNGIGIAGQGGIPRATVYNHNNLIDPYFGFAYDVSGNGKTVLRGGFNLAHEKIRDDELIGLQANPPFSFQAQLYDTTLTNTGGIAASGGQFPAFVGSMSGLDIQELVPSTAQYSLGVQRELFPRGLLSLSYVGSAQRHQSIQRDVNQPLMDNPLRGTVSPNFARPFPGYGSILKNEFSTNGNYNSLQLSLRVNDYHGLTLQSSYTWSHAIDIASADEATILNAYDIKAERGNSDLDRRHILLLNYIYDLPFGAGKQFLSSSKGILNQLVGGWQLSGITTFSTGLPFSVSFPGDPAGIGKSVRANLVGNPNTGPRTADEFFNTSAFAAVAAVGSVAGATGFGNEGRNVVRGAGRNQWDISLFKNFTKVPLPGSKEGGTLQFRAEFFNAFNHTQFNSYFTTFGNPGFAGANNAFDPRVIEFALKFSF